MPSTTYVRGWYCCARTCTGTSRRCLQRWHVYKKGGEPRLGSEPPKGRVPLIRSRLDRTMGSSILASLSEAGGNDPFCPVNGPLPPHSPGCADRVGTRPTPLSRQVNGLLDQIELIFGSWIFNDLTNPAACAHGLTDSIREPPSRVGTGDAAFRLPNSHSPFLRIHLQSSRLVAG